MPKFGKRSKDHLKGVDAKLQNVPNEVVKYFDITVIEGLRSQKRQNELVAQGKSKTKFGKHVDGKAVMDIKIRWGGDWNASSTFEGQRTTKDNNFDDLVHFEILE